METIVTTTTTVTTTTEGEFYTNGNAIGLLRAAYSWLAFKDAWDACLGWNVGLAGLLIHVSTTRILASR